MYATTYGIKIEFSSIFLLLIFRRLLFIYYCQNIAQKLIFYFPGRIWPWKSEAERIKLHIERVSLKVASFIMVLSDIFLTYLCHSALHSIIFPHTEPEQKYFFLILWAFKAQVGNPRRPYESRVIFSYELYHPMKIVYTIISGWDIFLKHCHWSM